METSNPAAIGEKFGRGDVVVLSSGDKVVLLASYADQFGGDNNASFTVADCLTGCEWSWADTCKMRFVRSGGQAEIERVRGIRDARVSQQSNIDWIVAQWPQIRSSPPGATIVALAALIGISERELWGPNGEGISFFENGWRVASLFDEVLMGADAQAVREFAADYRSKRKSTE